jgi:methionine-rich copper-binding protein CopC
MATKLPAALLLLLLASIPFWPTPAAAHAIVVSSSPSPGETVKKSEIPIELRFNSRIDRLRSRLVLMRPDGSQEGLALSPSGDESLESAAKGLEKGPYRLLWQALSVDGHVTHGEIPFEVGR